MIPDKADHQLPVRESERKTGLMNFRVRIRNPIWWTQIIASVLTPVLGYFGMNVQELTSWQLLGETLLRAIGNPYIAGIMAISVWNACNDPTTKGIGDSERAKGYDEPA